MKLHYNNTNFSLYILSLFVVTSIISCGTTQNIAYHNDGIYADDKPIERTKRTLIAVENKKYEEPQENFFSKELERLDKLNNNNDNNDVFTNIEDYSSQDDKNNTYRASLDNTINYNNNEPWGYSNADRNNVILNINNSPNWGFFNHWDNFYGYNYNRPWWGLGHYGYGNFYNNRFYNRGFYNYGFYNHGYYGIRNPYYRYNYRRYNRLNPYRNFRRASRHRGITNAYGRASKGYRRNSNNTRSIRRTRGNSNRTYTPSGDTNQTKRRVKSSTNNRRTKYSRNSSNSSRSRSTNRSFNNRRSRAGRR